MNNIKEPKSWHSITERWKDIHKQHVYSLLDKEIPINTIIDDTKSVEWNREYIKQHNRLCKTYSDKRNKYVSENMDTLLEDIYYAIQCEIGYDISKEEAEYIWRKAKYMASAWKKEHDWVFTRNFLYELIDLVRDLYAWRDIQNYVKKDKEKNE